MKIEVYHVKDEAAPRGRSLLGSIGWGEVPIDMSKNHALVAVVEAHSTGLDALDEVYMLTQNIRDSWTRNPGVKTELSRCRSTHIGDVLVMESERYVCAPVGWTKITSDDQKIIRG